MPRGKISDGSGRLEVIAYNEYVITALKSEAMKVTDPRRRAKMLTGLATLEAQTAALRQDPTGDLARQADRQRRDALKPGPGTPSATRMTRSPSIETIPSVGARAEATDAIQRRAGHAAD